MSELPEGWAEAELGTLGTWSSGGTPSKSNPSFWSGTIPWVSPKDLKTDFITDSIDHVSRAAVAASRLKILPPGTLLFVVRGMILARAFPVALTRVPVTINQDIRALTPHEGIDPEYLFRTLQNEAHEILFAVKEATHGTLRLDSDQLQQWPLRIPPLTEQRRIVKKVQALLDKTDSARLRLDRLEDTLRRLKTHVVASLLERDSGSWRECRFGTVVTEIRNGVSPKPFDSPPGVPILRVSSVRTCSVSLDSKRFLRNGERFLEQFTLRERDLLFTRYNGTVDLVGVCGMVRNLGDSRILYPDKLMRVRLIEEEVLPEFAELHFATATSRQRIMAETRSSAGQHGISGKTLLNQPFAYPDLHHQRAIVKHVGALFDVVETVAATIQAARDRTLKVPRSILSKAFAGDLVPTEAELARREGRSYEPASAVLELARAEREMPTPSQDRRAAARSGRGRAPSSRG